MCAAILGITLTAGAAGPYLASEEQTVFQLVNQTRAQNGQPALTRQSALDQMARGQTDRMVERGSIYHNPNLGAEATSLGLNWQLIGENVGVGPNVEVIHQAFVDSPPHFDNIVESTFTHLGVGVVRAPNGRIYVTHVFADLVAAERTAEPAPAPAPAPRPVPAPAAPTPAPVLAPPPALPLPPHAVVGGEVDTTPLASVDTTPLTSNDELALQDGTPHGHPEPPSVLPVIAGLLRRIAGITAFWG